MKIYTFRNFCISCFFLVSNLSYAQKTVVEIRGKQFYINGKPTYEGRYWKGNKVEGLLLNSRMVQGVFDDLNPKTVSDFAYPDTQKWDAVRNNKEFVAAMPIWKSYGLNAFTVNMQGGSPTGYGNYDFYNPGFNADGSLMPAYMKRLDNILKKADDLKMVVILGFFYFGQDQRLKDEAAIKNAVTNMMNWLHKKGYRNVLIEINNETQVSTKTNYYDHEILTYPRVHELILLAKSIKKNEYVYPVSTSFAAQTVPTENVLDVADFVLFHANILRTTEKYQTHITNVIKAVGDRNIPIVSNEDDNHFFDQDTCHFNIAIQNYISWGFFDYRKKEDPDLKKGYQTIPVDWGINSESKKGFFNKVKEISGTPNYDFNAISKNDFVRLEAENTKSLLGNWNLIKKDSPNYVAKASGNSYLEFMGNNPDTGDPNSPLEYSFKVPTDGNYRLIMMSSKRLEGVRGDLCNDAYVKMSGNYETASGLDEKTMGNYLKYFQEGSVKTPENQWHWALRAERGKHEFFELIYKFKKGENYKLTVAGRSQRFSIDYIVFYNADKMTLEQARVYLEKNNF